MKTSARACYSAFSIKAAGEERIPQMGDLLKHSLRASETEPVTSALIYGASARVSVWRFRAFGPVCLY